MKGVPEDANRTEKRNRGLRFARLGRAGPLSLALLGVAVVAAACGGVSASPGVASLGSTTTTSAAAGSAASSGGLPNLQKAYQAQLQYSQCMRTHGEPSFPDPVLSAHGLSISGGNINPNSPQFISASTACKKLVPNGGPPSQAQIQAAVARALKYSECMRAHGVPSFPDPDVSNGGVRISIGAPGINPNSPQFQAAQKTCQQIAPLGGAR